MSKARELLKKLDENTIPMSGTLRWEDKVGLVFQSENEAGDRISIVIPTDKETLLSIINGQTHGESNMCEGVKVCYE